MVSGGLWGGDGSGGASEKWGSGERRRRGCGDGTEFVMRRLLVAQLFDTT